ncbi:hypothetical protein SAMN04489806_1199 [Paramicrobacterium humi]|uniref:DUF4386 family protein n=1 Tax=Paramicrobacterium humi TaxID=640635 RepID=A0A1H4KJX3_9MICO|nr:hypothetical protein [Microbacterium humi]SEB58801.1 hypothetical protein SAMN04489806_1199 [Microbacterium humi]
MTETITTSTSRDRAAYRAAGWGGIGAFAAWALQPVVVALAAAEGEAEYPAWQDGFADNSWRGGVEMLAFAGIGVGLLFLVIGVGELVRQAGNGASTAARVGTTMGVAGALMWLLWAGAVGAGYSSVGAGIPLVAPDEHLQAALLQLQAIEGTGYGVAFAVLTAGWTVLLLTAGRRSGLIGVPLSVVLCLALAAFVAGVVTPFSVPWGMIAFVLQALVLGVAFLVKAHRP